MMPAFVAAITAALLARLLIGVARRRSILAIPNARSSHSTPTPTLGGVSIALPVLAWCVYRIGQDPLCWAALGGGGTLVILGVVDDLHDLTPRVRLPIQCIAVALVLSVIPIAIPLVITPISINPAWLVFGLDFLLLLWLVNLYNFMDGIDGLAATQCVIYCVGALAIGHSAAFTTGFLWILLGAAIGFLYFNLAPARIFMGDVGSGLLGLVIGATGLTLDARDQLPLIASLILLAGFWFDATYTLCVRIVTGQSFASAHRSHLYQKCARRFGHGRTTTMFTGFAIAWLMPLTWLSVAVPEWGLALTVAAPIPLLIASIRMRAGYPDDGVIVS